MAGYKFAMFDAPQAGAIVAHLEHRAATADTEVERASTRQALESYWRHRA